MSEPKQINLLDDPRVWTGPVAPRTDQRLPSFEQPYGKAECVYRPDPFNNLPNPKNAWADEYPIKPLPDSPKVNLTPEQEKKIKEMMAAGDAARGNVGKPRWSLLALEVFEPVVRVLMFGAKKYAAWNFTSGKGLSWTETGECMQRHLNAWLRGEDNDPESGESHLGHIGCNLMFLLYYRMYAHKGYGERDDRNKR